MRGAQQQSSSNNLTSNNNNTSLPVNHDSLVDLTLDPPTMSAFDYNDFDYANPNAGASNNTSNNNNNNNDPMLDEFENGNDDELLALDVDQIVAQKPPPPAQQSYDCRREGNVLVLVSHQTAPALHLIHLLYHLLRRSVGSKH
eukprot:scaffold15841_cov77-Skeletonema_dohrnii-CCMP3373.AAC.2